MTKKSPSLNRSRGKTVATQAAHSASQEIVTRLDRIDTELHKLHDFQEQIFGRTVDALEKLGEEVESRQASDSLTVDPLPTNELPAAPKKPCNCHKKQEGPDFADGVWVGVALGMLMATTIVWIYRQRAYSLYWGS